MYNSDKNYVSILPVKSKAKSKKSKIDNNIYYDLHNNISKILILRSFPNKKSTLDNIHQEVNDELSEYHLIADSLISNFKVMIDIKKNKYVIASKPSTSSIILELDSEKELDSEMRLATSNLIKKLIRQKLVANNFVNLFFSSKFVININNDRTLINELSDISKNNQKIFSKKIKNIVDLDKKSDKI